VLATRQREGKIGKRRKVKSGVVPIFSIFGVLELDNNITQEAI